MMRVGKLLPHWAWFLAAAPLLLASCTDSDPLLFEEATALEVVGAPFTEGTVGEATAQRPQVRALDHRGNPAAGVAVHWSVSNGHGSVTRTRVYSDNRGLASPGEWTLGTGAGEQTLRASLDGDPDSSGTEPVTFQATAEPGPPDAAVATRGEETTGRVGAPLEVIPQLKVTDQYGNPVPQVAVHFQSQDGEVEGGETVTDAQGQAGPSGWVLGPVAGPQEMTGQVEGLPPVSFTALADPEAPDTLVVSGVEADDARVGDPLPPFTVQAQDRFGNPVPGEAIQVEVTEGGGTVSPLVPVTDEEGDAVLEWTLGPTPGSQSIQLQSGELSPILVQVQAQPGPPAEMTPVAGVDLEPVAPEASVPEPPAVALVDRFGNPTPDLQVTFHVLEGGGSVDGSPALTDEDGEAVLVSWTVGPEPGPNQVEARHGDLPPVTFQVEASEAAVREIQIIQGEGQEAVAGFPVETPPGVRLLDGSGSPVSGETVSFQVVEGGGSIAPNQVTTNAQGEARTEEWTLGPEAGTNRIRIHADGAPDRTLTATGLEGFQVTVEAVHLNQGNQTLGGEIPLQEGRDGLLRVFLRANEANAESPRVRVVLYHGSSQVFSHVLQGGGGQVPTSIDPNQLSRSWNVEVPQNLIRSNLGIRVYVDEDQEMTVLDRSLLAWPSGGGIHRPHVVDPPPFRATFIQIESTDLETVADLNAGNLSGYMARTVELFPIADHDAIIRPNAPYVTSAAPLSGPNQGEGWVELVQEILALRFDDGDQDPAALERYYHGILQRESGPGIAGIAYVATSPNSQALAAVSHDDPADRDIVVAHEFGHNLGRNHAPCGNAGGVDPGYPYAGATLGSPGYNPLTGQFIPTDGPHRDIMSYCTPVWSSDYTYDAVLAMRTARPIGAPALAVSASTTHHGSGTTVEDGIAVGDATAAAAGAGHPLLVWGGWSQEGGPYLRPVLRLRDGARAPAQVPGDGTQDQGMVRGYGHEGELIFQQDVTGLELAHVDDPTTRHIQTLVRISPEEAAALARIILETPYGSTELDRSWDGPDRVPGTEPAPGAPDPRLRVERVTGGAGGPAGAPGQERIRLEWDADAYPQLVLRDGPDGAITGILQGGRAVLTEPASHRLDVELSDGVGVLRQRVSTR